MNKLVLEAPKIEQPTLYEVLRFVGNGLNIADEKWDFSNHFNCPRFEDIKNNYDKLMVLFSLNMRVSEYDSRFGATTNASEFIENNKKAFTRFMNEENNLKLQPQHYGNEIDNDDELFDELYITTFKNLINGGYSEKNYEKLYNYIIEYSEE